MSAIVTLRPDQNQVKGGITVKWLAGLSFILAVAATGWGKTVLFSKIIAEEPGASVVIAHRHELVGQISMALARNGVRHRVVGSSELAKDCTAAHIDELGVNYVDPNSRVGVASVDTLILKEGSDWQAWFDSIKLWVMDEAHHLLRHNKWGKAVALFRNARGLGVTAETERADGYGLGEMNDGIFQDIVLAPTMRDVINMGNLTDYKVYVPPSDLDLTQVDVGPSGEFSPKKLSKATKNSHITGDVVKHYLKLAPGKLGITFAVDIEAAQQIAHEFRLAGVPAEVVSSKTKSTVRRKILKDFRARRILQLVNVDLFGEGFDLPAIEVVSMARATQSFNLYKQQFGRALRLMAGKQWAIIIDHVGNVIRHGLPDQKRDFTLGRPIPRAQREGDENIIPMTVCNECSMSHERIYNACIHCGHKKEPAARTAPAYVDGDLFELSWETMAKMRGEADAVIRTTNIPVPQGLPAYAQRAIEVKHIERASAQAKLRDTMMLWAGWQRDHMKYTDSQIYRLHYVTYGMDMMTAQALGAAEADELRGKLQRVLDSAGVVLAQNSIGSLLTA